MNFQCVTTNNGDDVFVAAGSPAATVSATLFTDTVVPTGVVAVTDLVGFQLQPRRGVNALRLLAHVQVAWQVTVGGGAASTGRLVATVERSSEGGAFVTLPGIVVGRGPTRSTAGVVGPFFEMLTVEVPRVRFDDNDIFALTLQLEIINAVAGNATIRLRHNPAVVADAHVVEAPRQLDPII